MAIIIRDMIDLGSERKGQEIRLRRAVFNMRAEAQVLLTAGKLQQLPVVVDVPYASVGARGSLIEEMRKKLAQVYEPPELESGNEARIVQTKAGKLLGRARIRLKVDRAQF